MASAKNNVRLHLDFLQLNAFLTKHNADYEQQNSQSWNSDTILETTCLYKKNECNLILDFFFFTFLIFMF